MGQGELPRGSSALQRLAVAAEAGTATSSRQVQDQRLGTGTERARSTGPSGRCATPTHAAAAPGIKPQGCCPWPPAAGAGAGAGVSASTLEQLAQSLNKHTASPLAAELHAPLHARRARPADGSRAGSAPAAATPPVGVAPGGASWPPGGPAAALSQPALAAMPLHSAMGSRGSLLAFSTRPTTSHSAAGACLHSLPASNQPLFNGKPPARASLHHPEDARLSVRPHRTAPYKPGMLLSPEQLTSEPRAGAGAAATAARPSTANPITHNLIDPRDPSWSRGVAAAPPGSRLGSCPAAAEPLTVPGLAALSRLRTPASSHGGGGGGSCRQPQSQQLLAAAHEPGGSVRGRTAALGLRPGDPSTSCSMERGSTTEAGSRGSVQSPRQHRTGREGDAEGQQPRESALSGSRAEEPRAGEEPGDGGVPGFTVAEGGEQGQQEGGLQSQGLEAGRGPAAGGAGPGSPGGSRPCTASSNYSTQALALGSSDARRRRGGGRGLGSVAEDDDVDSVDLTLQRLRHDNTRHDGGASIDLVGDVSMADLDSVLGLSRDGRKAGRKPGLLAGKAGAQGRQAAQRRARAAAAQAAPMVLSLEDLTESTPEVLELEMGRMSLEELLQLDARVSGAGRGLSG